jgi:hypothetical protein
MLGHAAGVSYERGEERRRIERTCEYCGEERVFNGVCNDCNRRQQTPDKIEVKRSDTISWKGRTYVGDDEESAQQKFKKADPRGFMEYSFGTQF